MVMIMMTIKISRSIVMRLLLGFKKMSVKESKDLSSSQNYCCRYKHTTESEPTNNSGVKSAF